MLGLAAAASAAGELAPIIASMLARERNVIVHTVVEQARQQSWSMPSVVADAADEVVAALIRAVGGAVPDVVDDAVVIDEPVSWELVDACLRAAMETILERSATAASTLDAGVAVATVTSVAQRLSWAAIRLRDAMTGSGPRAGRDGESAEGVVRAALRGDYPSDEIALRAALRAGHDLRNPHGVIGLAAHRAPNGSAGGDLAAAMASMRRLVAAAVTADVHEAAGHAMLVVAVPPLLRRVLRTDAGSEHGPTWSHAIHVAGEVARTHGVCAVVVAPVEGVAALRQSIARAERMARLVADTPGSVFSEGELSLDLLLDSVDADVRELFVSTVLDPVLRLTPARAAPLLETIRALTVSKGSFAVAAKVLGVHRETVKYRAHRLRDLTGYSVADPNHLMRLDLALRLQQSGERRAGVPADRDPLRARTLVGGRY